MKACWELKTMYRGWEEEKVNDQEKGWLEILWPQSSSTAKQTQTSTWSLTLQRKAQFFGFKLYNNVARHRQKVINIMCHILSITRPSPHVRISDWAVTTALRTLHTKFSQPDSPNPTLASQGAAENSTQISALRKQLLMRSMPPAKSTACGTLFRVRQPEIFLPLLRYVWTHHHLVSHTN